MPQLSTTNIIILYAQQDGRCYYCGDNLDSLVLSGTNIEIDHKVPVSGGGLSKTSNYCIACKWCNRRKVNKSVAEFMAYVKPYREGVVLKKDVGEYNKYLGLHKHFSHTVNSNSTFEPTQPITIVEYAELMYRLAESEEAIQELFARLERYGISKHCLEQ